MIFQASFAWAGQKSVFKFNLKHFPKILHLSAKHLELNHLEKSTDRLEIKLKKDIRFEGKNFKLTCNHMRLVFSTGKQRSLISIVATRQARVLYGKRRGNAKEISINIKTKKIILKGDASIFEPQMRLTLKGDKIVLDLSNEKVQVDNAQLKVGLND